MKYEGINFNTDWVRTTTLDQFIDHEKHHFVNDPKGTEKLTEIHGLINGKPSVKKEKKLPENKEKPASKTE